MIVPGSASPLLTTTDGGYTIAKSLRFRSSASAYLSRTPASAGNQKTWTFSTWLKRGQLTRLQKVFEFGSSSSNYITMLWNGAGGGAGADQLDIYSASGGSQAAYLDTTALYRDPAAWYHIVLSVDTTQSTASNRIKLYVNGSEAVLATASYPTQNTDLFANSTALHRIGNSSIGGTNQEFDGYLADTYLIDGQQLTPSSFGETDATTGVWKPKAYSGTYGTNGFYLKFTDVATTSGSNAGLGKDFSGNGNYWTTNNISVTSGTTYDSMKDVPTLTDTDTANYAVLNPLTSLGTNGSISDGNLTNTGGANPAKVFTSTIAVKNGNKFYAEFKLTGGANYAQVAVVDILSLSTTSGGMRGNGQIVMECNAIETAFYINSSSKTTGSGTFATNDIVMIAFDSTTRNVWFGKNGTWLNSGDPSTASNPIGAVANSNELNFAIRAESTTMTANFGQQPFAYTPPTGYKALNTYNLPDSTIVAGNVYMDATTWTGDGSTSRAITTSSSFKPDLVWIKQRSNVISHTVYDTIRGASTGSTSKSLVTNATAAEGSNNDNSTYGYLDSFTSTGFTTVRGTNGTTSYTNASGGTYVAWQWQAGQGSSSSNTSGTITSTVSVNASAGFSIVTYTGTGTTGTVGHGLGVAPKMVIVKARNQADSWIVYHAGLPNPATNTIILNSTDAVQTSSLNWNSTAPTSSVFSVYNPGSGGYTNGNGYTYVAYCWSEIAGFSKFGSYTGNLSTDGPFVYLGFKPKYIMFKNATTGSNQWEVYDTTRDKFNSTGTYLLPAVSDAEGTFGTTNRFDYLSNGFKVRNTGGSINGSGETIIYAAFAENPFKNSLAR